MDETLKTLREMGVELSHKWTHKKTGDAVFAFTLATVPDPIAAINAALAYMTHKALLDSIGKGDITTGAAVKSARTRLDNLHRGEFPEAGGSREGDPVVAEFRSVVAAWLMAELGKTKTAAESETSSGEKAQSALRTIAIAKVTKKTGKPYEATAEGDERNQWLARVNRGVDTLWAAAMDKARAAVIAKSDVADID